MIVATIRHYIHHVSSYYTIYVGPIAYHATKLPKLFLPFFVLRLALLRLWLAHHLAFLLIVASALSAASSATTAAATLLGGALEMALRLSGFTARLRFSCLVCVFSLSIQSGMGQPLAFITLAMERSCSASASVKKVTVLPRRPARPGGQCGAHTRWSTAESRR